MSHTTPCPSSRVPPPSCPPPGHRCAQGAQSVDTGEHQNLLQGEMQKPQQDHSSPLELLCVTHCPGDTGQPLEQAEGLPHRAGSWSPLTPCSWRGWFVDSSAVTSFGDVGFRSPPVWEPDPSCSAAPVNSGQGMRAAPAAEGELPGASLPAQRPHPAPLQAWKGPVPPTHPLKGFRHCSPAASEVVSARF